MVAMQTEATLKDSNIGLGVSNNGRKMEKSMFTSFGAIG
jgi:hypothetical protein